MPIFRTSYPHPNKWGGKEIMGPNKGVKHVTLQESNSLKGYMHSASRASMAAILQLENDLIDFS